MSTPKTAPEFNNDGKIPLQVPGIGCKIDVELPHEEHFAHGLDDWIQRPRLTVRELAMLRLMDALSDKKDWHKKIFDDDIVKKWHDEALMMPLISEKTWDWCLSELQDKAVFFEQHGFVLTLDTGSRCAKSDTLIEESMRNQLVQEVQPLLQTKEKDWHPNSNEQVLNLVHPSLFPLVYGRSRVLETGQVGLEDCVEACGRGVIAPSEHKLEKQESPGIAMSGHFVNDERWSSRFQWLPCEVKFQDTSGTDAHIASYINNLHPIHHRDLYIIVGKLIAKAIPLWNEILIKDPAIALLSGRTPPRIQTTGHESEPAGLPEWTRNMMHDPDDPSYPGNVARVKEYLALPDNPGYVADDDYGHDEQFLNGSWEEHCNLHSAVRWKFQRIRRIKHPEPGVAYTYEDWKAGRTNGSAIGRSNYSERCTHQRYSIDLEDQFREMGLQVITKLASIEVTPEKPNTMEVIGIWKACSMNTSWRPQYITTM